MSGVDIIGDLHGCATELEHLLQALGYAMNSESGAYEHAERKVIFVGDLIDRGSEQERTLRIVKGMSDSGNADVLMGNHEFNAIAYGSEHPFEVGAFLRPHTYHNSTQHSAFLSQLSHEQQRYYLQWFRSFPLWIDTGNIRVVHACWHEPSIALLARELGGNRFTSFSHFVRALTHGDPLFEAVEVLLKGPEISLVNYGALAYCEPSGISRPAARLRWWDPGARTLRELAELSESLLTEDGRPYPPPPNVEVPASERDFGYSGSLPVFYGHYWRRGSPTKGVDWTTKTACVDFSAVRGGDLVAYRWTGEAEIQVHNFTTARGHFVSG